MDLGMVSTTGKEQPWPKVGLSENLTWLVNQTRIFTKKGAEHLWHMQTFKGTNLGLMGQAKAWIHKHSRSNNHTYRLKLLSKGNLLGDNYEINIT